MALAGSTTPNHDILLAIRAMPDAVSDADWNGLFWSAGLRWQESDRSAYTGSANVTGQGKLVWSRRVRSSTETYHFTGVNGYSLGSDGTGSLELNQVALGADGHAFVGSGVSNPSPGAYEICFGIGAEDLSGEGVFLHPNGVVNAASFAPAGNPISPGSFLTLFGSGLAPVASVTDGPPFPFSLEGVEVLVDNRRAPIYAVSPGQLSVLAPHGISAGTATIVVNNNGEQSNAVEATVSATSPGSFSSPSGGIGHGAILKTDWSVVSASNPARAGDVVQIYLTGLGAVDPVVADGAAAPASPLSWVTSPVTVYVGGQEAEVLFKGLAPGLAGLYQLNVRIPQGVPPGTVPLAVSTPDAFHDQVDIAIAP